MERGRTLSLLVSGAFLIVLGPGGPGVSAGPIVAHPVAWAEGVGDTPSLLGETLPVLAPATAAGRDELAPPSAGDLASTIRAERLDPGLLGASSRLLLSARPSRADRPWLVDARPAHVRLAAQAAGRNLWTIPEPASALLLLTGVLGYSVRRRMLRGRS